MPILIDLQERYDAIVAAEFAAHPPGDPEPLQEADLAGLPEPVRRYVRSTGALGRPRPRNVRVEFDAGMRRRPGGGTMPSTSIQYNFFDRPTRLFLMEARMFGLPVRALHVYRDETATFRVRVASLVDMVNLSGPEISAAETVTVLNDMCVMAPGTLADPRLTWEDVDARSSLVRLTNGPHAVTATLIFDDDGLLVDFVSDDRPDSSTGTFVPRRWRTPLSDYRPIADGVRVATKGAAIYDHPEGPFAYGEFRMRSIAYDVSGPA